MESIKIIIPDACTEDINKYYEMSNKELGKGTYGKVVLGTLKNTNIKRAIKIIPKEGNKHLERIKSEVDIMKKLDHPNILRLYEAFEDSKYIYLVIELCKGGELFDRIIENDYFDEAAGREIFKQIIKSIRYCHMNSVCHRDLKPENFLFMVKENEQCLKLIDFGLSKSFFHLQKEQQAEESNTIQNAPRGRRARRTAPKTNMKTRAGTPFYIAPEVLTGNYLEKCDVWSAGVIFYILLCGYPPFYGDNNKEILASVKKGDLDFTGDEWEGKSKEVFDLLRKMICKEGERLGAEEVLSHPWILNIPSNQQANKASLKEKYQLMLEYSKLPKFSQITLISLAKQLNENEKEVMGIQKSFFSIDYKNDGELSMIEFLEVGKQLELQKSMLMETFSVLDIFEEEKLKYSQFMASCIHSKNIISPDLIKLVFRLWDQDGDGLLSLDDFTKTMNKLYPKKSPKPSLLKTDFGRELLAEFNSLGLDMANIAKFETMIKTE